MEDKGVLQFLANFFTEKLKLASVDKTSDEKYAILDGLLKTVLNASNGDQQVSFTPFSPDPDGALDMEFDDYVNSFEVTIDGQKIEDFIVTFRPPSIGSGKYLNIKSVNNIPQAELMKNTSQWHAEDKFHCP